MSKRVIGVIVVAVVLLVVVAVVALQAQGGPRLPQRPVAVRPLMQAPDVQLGFSGLELRIRADREQYNLGEPIVLYVSLANTGNQPQGVLDILEPEANYVQFQITPPGSNTAETFLPAIVRCTDAGPVQLNPGQVIAGMAKLFYGQQGWVFTRPGAYTVQATYLNRVQSNRLTLTVVEGTGENREAGRLLVQSDQAGRFLYLEGGDHLTEGRSVLQRISDQFGQSALAPYANFALGASLSEDFANFQTQTLRQADLPTAIRYLERSRQRLPQSAYYAMGLLGRLNLCHTALGNQAVANAVANQLQTVVNGLSPDLAPFSRPLLLLHGGPSNLRLNVPNGLVAPRNLPTSPR